MKTLVHNGSFKEKLVHLFEDNESLLSRNDTKYISQVRYRAFDKLKELEIPSWKQEQWKNTNLKETLSKDYYQYLEKPSDLVPLDSLLTCEVHNFETDQVSFYNGWMVKTSEALKNLPEAFIVCSMAEAMEKHKELVDQHFARYNEDNDNLFHALNTAFTQDGLFLYIPDNMQVERPVQMISIINHRENLLIQNRNLIILGKNSRLTLVQCDDSTNHQPSFTNSVTEIFMGENSELVHYKLQNLNNDSTLLNSTSFHQLANSRMTTYALSFNGGMIRNETSVKLNGKGALANIYGLYLLDKKQHVDNRVFVEHAVPECTSNELFKGILDNEATAVFNGHILVKQDAQKTNAYQKNQNMLLTDLTTANSLNILSYTITAAPFFLSISVRRA